ncbi:MAG TPA: competence/damage-inducible protein A [Elusimicrobiota bacterium]|nr:competence/damage-inducible protein A [Elusimicrobiota bacterium]
MTRVELVCIGSELLFSKINTHVVPMSAQLARLGLCLSRVTIVEDDRGEMDRVFRESWRRAGIVITTGGLGPTFDDLTREVWAKTLHRPLRLVPSFVDAIREKFKRRGYRMPAENARQAYVIGGATVMENPVGTAPGQILSDRGKTAVLLPGPLREMLPMLRDTVIPSLEKKYGRQPLCRRVYRIFGDPESVVDERLKPLRERWRSTGPTQTVFGILASRYVIDIELMVRGKDFSSVTDRYRRVNEDVFRRFGPLIFGLDDDTLESLVGRFLRHRRETVSVAESCTGGMLMERLTDVPGSSDYFEEGLVTYSNESKKEHLGVPVRLLSAHGAVSSPCAVAMARGIRRRSGTDWGISITGIAGPSGGTDAKPVGLVYIAVDGTKGTDCHEHLFIGDRPQIRERAVATALHHLLKKLGGIPLSLQRRREAAWSR